MRKEGNDLFNAFLPTNIFKAMMTPMIYKIVQATVTR
jgi:hypothetical protein